jgi:hypothetical protein
MDETRLQAAVTQTLETGDAKWEIRRGRDALVLSVKEGHPLCELVDEWFEASMKQLKDFRDSLVPEAIPTLRIGGYTVSPKFERELREGWWTYELVYSPHP